MDYKKLTANKTFSLIYEIFMALLSLTVVIMLIFESITNLTANEAQILDIIDYTILIIFAIDYFTRLFFAESKKTFIKNNIIDLIAIIPFNSVFQAARTLRITRLIKLTRLIKITRLARAFVFLNKFKKKIDRFLKTNNFNYVLWITGLTVLFGAIGMCFTEHESFADGLWWSFVTVTTVGYGDISPSTSAGRVIAAILMLIGIGFIGMLTGTIATFFIKTKEKNITVRDKTVEMIKSKLDEYENLSNEDIDYLCKLIHTLKNTYSD